MRPSFALFCIFIICYQRKIVNTEPEDCLIDTLPFISNLRDRTRIGSPRYAMGAMLAGTLVNIVGDPVAIFVLNMGSKGAAYATILGQFVSFCIYVAYLP